MYRYISDINLIFFLFFHKVNAHLEEKLVIHSFIITCYEPYHHTCLMLTAAALVFPESCVIYVFIILDTLGVIRDHPWYPLCSFAV